VKNENRRDLKERTREFALRVVRCYAALPRTTVAQVLGKQMLRAGTSVGAHYREGVRSRSDAEFVSKLEGALQELEETCYWLELLAAEQLGPKTDLASLAVEADELTAILVTCVKKVKARRARVRDEGGGMKAEG
jgi:four helix bundle protein